MPVQYKMDILAALKGRGYSTYRIRKDKLLSESTVQKLRSGEGVSWENISTLCKLLNCQPGDIMEYAEDERSE
jgi:putative transcriptional regulator